MRNVLVILAIILTYTMNAQIIDFDGFLDSYNSVQLKKEHNFNSSRIRFRGNLYTEYDNASLFVSFNGMNNQINNENSLKLHEAYIQYLYNSWNIRVGKQLVVWGKADGLRITDNICPNDYSEFVTQDFDDTRLPIEMFNVTYSHDFYEFNVLLIPLFEGSIFPESGSPWFQPIKNSENIIFKKPKKVKENISNSEIALKASFYLPKVDFALSYFKTTDDEPIPYYSINDNKLVSMPKFYKTDIIGAEFTSPFGDIVLRGEAAYKNKHFDSSNNLKKETMKTLLGLDWYPSSEWTMLAQICNEHIFNYENTIKQDKNIFMSTLNISRKLLNETLSIQNMLYYQFNDEDIYNRLSADYALNDNLHLLSGVDIFNGKKGIYSRYKNKSQIWIKTKYNF